MQLTLRQVLELIALLQNNLLCKHTKFASGVSRKPRYYGLYVLFYERLMDMQYKRFVEELKQQVDTYLQQVNSIGNECAYTDRLLEQIITKAKQIEQVYHNN